jgi:hypothetical protein
VSIDGCMGIFAFLLRIIRHGDFWMDIPSERFVCKVSAAAMNLNNKLVVLEVLRWRLLTFTYF